MSNRQCKTDNTQYATKPELNNCDYKIIINISYEIHVQDFIMKNLNSSLKQAKSCLKP